MRNIIKIIILVDFVRKIKSDKFRDHCQLSGKGKNRGPAHQKSNNNVTQKQSNFIPFEFHNFIDYDCHPFFKRLVDKKNDQINFDITR